MLRGEGAYLQQSGWFLVGVAASAAAHVFAQGVLSLLRTNLFLSCAGRQCGGPCGGGGRRQCLHQSGGCSGECNSWHRLSFGIASHLAGTMQNRRLGVLMRHAPLKLRLVVWILPCFHCLPITLHALMLYPSNACLPHSPLLQVSDWMTPTMGILFNPDALFENLSFSVRGSIFRYGHFLNVGAGRHSCTRVLVYMGAGRMHKSWWLARDAEQLSYCLPIQPLLHLAPEPLTHDLLVWPLWPTRMQVLLSFVLILFIVVFFVVSPMNAFMHSVFPANKTRECARQRGSCCTRQWDGCPPATPA